MEFGEAEKIIKKCFIKVWKQTVTRWGQGERSDINDFLLAFYEHKITSKISKYEYS